MKTYQAGKYVLFKELRSNPFGRKFRAAELSENGLKRLVVLNSLDESLNIAAFHEHFKVYQSSFKNVVHDGIIKPYELYKSNSGFFLSEELIKGYSLTGIINRCRNFDIALTLDYALFIVQKVAYILDYAHSQVNPGYPLLHGAVTPASVFLSVDGDVKLGSWGLLVSSEEVAGPDKDIKNRIRRYLSPEQEMRNRTTARTDIFQIGLLLFEMLAGFPLFSVDRVENIDSEIAKLTKKQHNLPGVDLDKDVISVLRKSLKVDAGQGYSSIRALREDLDKIIYKKKFIITRTRTALFINSLYKDDINNMHEEYAYEASLDFDKYIENDEFKRSGRASDGKPLPDRGFLPLEREDVSKLRKFIPIDRFRQLSWKAAGFTAAFVIFLVIINLAFIRPDANSLAGSPAEQREMTKRIKELESEVQARELEKEAYQQTILQYEENEELLNKRFRELQEQRDEFRSLQSSGKGGSELYKRMRTRIAELEREVQARRLEKEAYKQTIKQFEENEKNLDARYKNMAEKPKTVNNKKSKGDLKNLRSRIKSLEERVKAREIEKEFYKSTIRQFENNEKLLDKRVRDLTRENRLLKQEISRLKKK